MPALRPGSFGRRDNRAFHHIAGARRVLRFRSGRLALASALARSGVGPDSEVLVPAYHCQSIVEPIEALGARPVFYRVQTDLSVDFSDIERKLTRDARSVIAVHFFGISADMSRLRELCNEVGATLIEDCAHCFSYSREPPAYGVAGNFVITSPRKFLPIYDGGELFSPKHPLPQARRESFELRYQLKIAANILERGLRRRKRAGNEPGHAENQPEFRTELEHSGDIDVRAATDYVDPRFHFDYVNCPTSVPSKYLTRLLSLAHVEHSRTRNFRKLSIASNSFRLGERAFPDLDVPAVPYIFPLILKGDSDLLHSRLRHAGVPMWRWDDLRQSDCGVSSDYSRSLIQLPCHQELEPDFVDRMIGALQDVLG